jgi:hypothetical protein
MRVALVRFQYGLFALIILLPYPLPSPGGGEKSSGKALWLCKMAGNLGTLVEDAGNFGKTFLLPGSRRGESGICPELLGEHQVRPYRNIYLQGKLWKIGCQTGETAQAGKPVLPILSKYKGLGEGVWGRGQGPAAPGPLPQAV